MEATGCEVAGVEPAADDDGVEEEEDDEEFDEAGGRWEEVHAPATSATAATNAQGPNLMIRARVAVDRVAVRCRNGRTGARRIRGRRAAAHRRDPVRLAAHTVDFGRPRPRFAG